MFFSLYSPKQVFENRKQKLLPNITLHSIHFYFFPFLYFKTSNQDYLIPFHSILFHSFSLLKYIPFSYDYSIPFLYELPNETLKLSIPSIKTPKQGKRRIFKNYYFHSFPFHSIPSSQTRPESKQTLIIFLPVKPQHILSFPNNQWTKNKYNQKNQKTKIK